MAEEESNELNRSDLIMVYNSNIFKLDKQGARIQNVIYMINNQLFKLYINSNTVRDKSVFIIYTRSSSDVWSEFITGLIDSVCTTNLAHKDEFEASAFDEIIAHSEKIIIRSSGLLQHIT